MRENTTRLKALAAVAARDVRRHPDKPGPDFRAFVTYFNNKYLREAFADKMKCLDSEYWIKIAKAQEETIGPANVELWLGKLGGQMSLYLLPDQCQVPRKDLARNILGFFDALDIVG